ncbi:MAG: DNA double-strand break repair nuclease NurA [Candidatus Diapherotrites archaeon]
MGFFQFLENVITHIRGVQEKQERIGNTIRKQAKGEIPHNGNEPLFIENTLTHSIQKKMNDGKIAGVDSGFAGQSFYTMDIMMLRAAGACFTYENGVMTKAEYEPESFSLPQPIVNGQGLEREDFHKFVSLTRLQAETENAIQVIQKMKPDVCFMDGSLILHPADKPGSDSPLKKEYEKTISGFVELYKTALQKKCMLIGAIEDSRSTRLSEWIQKNMTLPQELQNEKMHDIPLLDKVLQPGERSMIFPIAEKNEKHPILSDFPTEWREKLFACYVKPSQWDYPLRIEFLSNGNTIEDGQRAAEIAHAQSNLHKDYAYPSILIEADMRAGLKPQEIELVSDKILSKIGRNTLRLKRRDRRPF